MRLVEVSSLSDHDVHDISRSNWVNGDWFPARLGGVEVSLHGLAVLNYNPEIGVSILVLVFVFSLRHIHLSPHGQVSLVSFGLGGGEVESVINQHRLEDHERDVEASNGQNGAQEHKVAGNELSNPVVPLWSRESGKEVLVHGHVKGGVVSDVLVVFHDELVQHLVLSVDNFKRKLSVSVVDSVVDDGVSSALAQESQREGEESRAGVRVIQSVAVERVSLIDSGVADGSREDNTSMEVHQRNHVESQEEERSSVKFKSNSKKIGVQANDFNEKLFSTRS